MIGRHKLWHRQTGNPVRFRDGPAAVTERPGQSVLEKPLSSASGVEPVREARRPRLTSSGVRRPTNALLVHSPRGRRRPHPSVFLIGPANGLPVCIAPRAHLRRLSADECLARRAGNGSGVHADPPGGGTSCAPTICCLQAIKNSANRSFPFPGNCWSRRPFAAATGEAIAGPYSPAPPAAGSDAVSAATRDRGVGRGLSELCRGESDQLDL